ncbi:RlpA-like double-psi beta-barrel-protein domain-containing protein-containing protein, partial [Mycena vulgaris]
GACGWWNTDAEFVVALTHLQWENGAHCGKEVNINWQGKSATAKIVDECMGCPYLGLDFSQSLFSFFVGAGNNEAVGWIW